VQVGSIDSAGVGLLSAQVGGGIDSAGVGLLSVQVGGSLRCADPGSIGLLFCSTFPIPLLFFRFTSLNTLTPIHQNKPSVRETQEKQNKTRALTYGMSETRVCMYSKGGNDFCDYKMSRKWKYVQGAGDERIARLKDRCGKRPETNRKCRN